MPEQPSWNTRYDIGGWGGFTNSVRNDEMQETFNVTVPFILCKAQLDSIILRPVIIKTYMRLVQMEVIFKPY
jgi:hypothetical protein